MAESRPKTFLDIDIDGVPAGRLVIELFSDVVPKTADNFKQLCIGDTRGSNGQLLTYKGTPFHRIIKGAMVLGGDVISRNGIGGESIYGANFPDENFIHQHSAAGLVSMFKSGAGGNNSQFFVTLNSLPKFDGKYVVFGRVLSGMDVIRKVEGVATDRNWRPELNVIISNCGELAADKFVASPSQLVNNQKLAARLTINILKARNLLAKDVGGTSDPYCVLWLSSNPTDKMKTKTIYKEIHPNWNQNFTLNVSKPFDSVVVEIYDENKIEKHAFLGRIEVDLVRFADQKPHEDWIPLTDAAHYGDSVRGDILVNFAYKFVPEWEEVYKGPFALLTAPPGTNYVPIIQNITSTILRYPEMWELLDYRSRAYVSNRQYREALADALTIIDYAPNSTDGYYRAGSVLEMSEEYTKAQEMYLKGSKINPKDPKIQEALRDMKKNESQQKLIEFCNDGRKAFADRDYNLALECFTKASQQHGSGYLPFLYKAVVYTLSDKPKEAQAEIFNSLVVDPSWPKVDYKKGSWLAKSGGKISLVKLRKRFFIWKYCFLFYYDGAEDPKPKGVIPLFNVGIEGDNAKKKFFAIKTPGRVYKLKAKTPQDKNDWVESLKAFMRNRIELPEESPDSLFKGSSAHHHYPGLETNVATRFFSKGLNVASTISNRISNALILVNLDNTTHSGYLSKKGRVNVNWKVRWFALISVDLFYFKTKPQGSEAAPQGTIRLTQAIFRDIIGVPFAFTLEVGTRTYLMKADEEQEYNDWKKFILDAGCHEQKAPPTPQTPAVPKEKEKEKEVKPVELPDPITSTATSSAAAAAQPSQPNAQPGKASPRPQSAAPGTLANAVAPVENKRNSTAPTAPTVSQPVAGGWGGGQMNVPVFTPPSASSAMWHGQETNPEEEEKVSASERRYYDKFGIPILSNTADLPQAQNGMDEKSDKKNESKPLLNTQSGPYSYSGSTSGSTDDGCCAKCVLS